MGFNSGFKGLNYIWAYVQSILLLIDSSFRLFIDLWTCSFCQHYSDR